MEYLLAQKWFKYSVTALWSALVALGAGLLLARVMGPTDLALVLLMAIIGYGVADLVSGIVHSLADHFGEETTPIVGALFIAPFRHHHEDPEGIVEESLGSLCLPAMVSSCPPLLIGLLLNASASQSGSVLGLLTLLLVVPTGAVFACVTHQLAHHQSPPAFAILLQRAGLILSKDAHQAHHHNGHFTQFCILSGRMNPLLDALIRNLRQLQQNVRVLRS